MLKVPVDEVFHACVLNTAFYRDFTSKILDEGVSMADTMVGRMSDGRKIVH